MAACPEALEAAGTFLFDEGSSGIEEGDGVIRAYFDGTVSADPLRIRLEILLSSLREQGLSVGEAVFREIPDEDWSAGWRSFYRPVVVTPKMVVKPPWEAWGPKPGQVVIDIMPRMAFGTGTHETTQLCLQLLEACLSPSQTVLDVGAGSGILSIAAARLGASHVVAVEIDEVAVENARENVAENGVQGRVEVRSGSVEVVGKETFDVVLANINRTVLVGLLPGLKCHMKPAGRLILSGILVEESIQMKGALISAGYHVRNERTMGEWGGLVVSLSG